MRPEGRIGNGKRPYAPERRIGRSAGVCTFRGIARVQNIIVMDMVHVNVVLTLLHSHLSNEDGEQYYHELCPQQ